MSIKVGDEVKVREGKEYYDGKVVEVDGTKCKVHYARFNPRHDVWLEKNSSRIVMENESGDEEFYVPGDDIGSVHPSGGTSATSDAPSAPVSAGNPDVLVSSEGGRGNMTVTCSKYCGLCGLKVSGTFVTCQGCYRPFHADSLCLGVSHDVARVLLEEKSGALSYNCCICRNKSARDVGTDSGAFSQMMVIVGSLVSEVKSSKNWFNPSSAGTDQLDLGRNSASSGYRISQEVKELYERDKRKDNIVIMGLQKYF